MLLKALCSYFVITIIFHSRSMPPRLSLFIFLLILRINEAKWGPVLLFSVKTQNLIIANECNKCQAVSSPLICICFTYRR